MGKSRTKNIHEHTEDFSNLTRGVFLVGIFASMIAFFVIRIIGSGVVGVAVIKPENDENYVVGIKNEEYISILLRMQNDSVLFHELDKESRLHYINDSIHLGPGTVVEIKDFLNDSAVVEIDFVNAWSYQGQKRNGFVLTRFLTDLKIKK